MNDEIMKKIIVYTHSDCLLKDNGTNHPEKKERLQVILKSIQNIKNLNIEIKNAPLAIVDNIRLVHPAEYINNIFFINSTIWFNRSRKRTLCRYTFVSK